MLTYFEVKKLEGKNVIIMDDDLSRCDVVRLVSVNTYPNILVENEDGIRGFVPVEWLVKI